VCFVIFWCGYVIELALDEVVNVVELVVECWGVVLHFHTFEAIAGLLPQEIAC